MPNQHTPGPWTVEVDHIKGRNDVYITPQGAIFDWIAKINSDKADANARLIAQAPILLAELIRSQVWLAKVAADHDGDGTGLSERAMKQHARNQAAIAAARGETP
jgi:hypothetical protein